MALSAQTPTQKPATLDDFLAIPTSERFHEILDGQLIRKATPSFDHGLAQARLVTALGPYDDEGGVSQKPGGWFIVTEVEFLAGKTPYRPDIVGWRADRMRQLPAQFPVAVRPDWVCEVVSAGDSARDTVIKFRDYARAGIPYYWLVDLATRRLSAFRLSGEHYMQAAEGQLGDRVRAEPFDLVEIAVSRLFPAEPRPEGDR